jgi:beta-glucoside kinase
MTHYVGFDIGGTSVKYGLVNAAGEILEKGAFVTTPDDGEQMIANMAKQVKAYQEKQDILSVGVSVPGIVRKDGYMVTAGAITSFFDINLKAGL